ncbi:DUF771 domain-containing protein [Streptococcus suis]|uniref:DUF771 domain-containing protein n=1 Tax=Streptococcus suis TaxID=1307 RepID=UPI0019615D75|nr:DUF771 domain-containing protein [Streptococcus suis]MBM7284962.1 DUF771 domain-containing protein [Streptococcus suis]MCO8236944.1 DUF771 domain-containing protein [Streptococcus suis]HEM3533524.1 DUF771 domain-containing protein [Streptococcus suis]
MIDTIQVQLDNITVKLPSTHLIVSVEEYQTLKKQSSQGQYMTLNEVLELLSVSRPWFLENVLYKPTIRKQIDIEQNKDGFVKYPQNQGGRYYFLASKTKKYFEEHFAEIFEL